ncbi:secreted protein [Beggiatoa sp. PS]|nr:secreted protein [Beggiatoa sp. PS]
MKYACFLLSIGLFLSLNISAQEINLSGIWESSTEDNHWQMEVTWNQTSNQYEGKLIKQGILSELVGFSIDELVWIAIPTSNVEELKEQQKYRYGSNGVSTGFVWRDGIVYLNKSTDYTLITSQSIFSRVSGANARQVCTDLTVISPDLTIHIPNADYQSLGGTMNLWVNLKFTPTDDGKMWWILDSYGVNP